MLELSWVEVWVAVELVPEAEGVDVVVEPLLVELEED